MCLSASVLGDQSYCLSVIALFPLRLTFYPALFVALELFLLTVLSHIGRARSFTIYSPSHYKKVLLRSVSLVMYICSSASASVDTPTIREWSNTLVRVWSAM